MGTGSPAAAGAPPAPNTETQPTADELIELALEEGKPPVKVPKSKLDPHLSKYRSETDKLRSEYDRNHKALSAREAKLEAILKFAKDTPDDALKALGLDPEAYAESKLAARVKKAMQESEEQADPSKKTAREEREELEALRKEKAEFDKQKQADTRNQTMGRVKAFVDNVVAKLPEEVQDFATPDVIAIVRQALAAGKDVTIEDAAKAARAQILARLGKARKLLDAEPAPANKVLQHPAARGNKIPGAGSKPKPEAAPSAGDILMDLQWGRKK